MLRFFLKKITKMPRFPRMKKTATVTLFYTRIWIRGHCRLVAEGDLKRGSLRSWRIDFQGGVFVFVSEFAF